MEWQPPALGPAFWLQSLPHDAGLDVCRKLVQGHRELQPREACIEAAALHQVLDVVVLNRAHDVTLTSPVH